MRDAAKAKQAVIDEDGSGGMRWIVPGKIEERSSASARSSARN